MQALRDDDCSLLFRIMDAVSVDRPTKLCSSSTYRSLNRLYYSVSVHIAAWKEGEPLLDRIMTAVSYQACDDLSQSNDGRFHLWYEACTNHQRQLGGLAGSPPYICRLSVAGDTRANQWHARQRFRLPLSTAMGIRR